MSNGRHSEGPVNTLTCLSVKLCCITVCDAGPTLKQHWVDVWMDLQLLFELSNVAGFYCPYKTRSIGSILRRCSSNKILLNKFHLISKYSISRIIRRPSLDTLPAFQLESIHSTCTSLTRHLSTKWSRKSWINPEEQLGIVRKDIAHLLHCAKVWIWLNKNSRRNITPIFGHSGVKTIKNQRKHNMFGHSLLQIFAFISFEMVCYDVMMLIFQTICGRCQWYTRVGGSTPRWYLGTGTLEMIMYKYKYCFFPNVHYKYIWNVFGYNYQVLCTLA